MSQQFIEAKLKSGQVDNRKRRFFAYIQGLKSELGKVSWTTRAELISSTKVVVISTLLFGIGIYLVDLVIKGVLDLVRFILLRIFT